MLGQVIFDLLTMYGISDDNSRALVGMVLIILTAILTGIGVFDKIAKYAGAGTMVPITGFANSVASPAMEYSSEGRILGTAANMFKIAGQLLNLWKEILLTSKQHGFELHNSWNQSPTNTEGRL